MNALEDFLRPTQEALFTRLQKMFAGNAVFQKTRFLLVRGEAPVLLIAHLDTVHREPVKTICQSEGGNILMSPQGIGGDDRCGVYGICKVYEATEKKPWLLFTCDEEIGAYGADGFCGAYMENKLPEGLNSLKMLVELDRKGKNDAVYYDCANPEFESYITGKDFRTASGSFSDISVIAPVLGIAAVNLSCGYYNAHTNHEYINRKQLKATVRKVVGMVADAAKEDFPRYEYMAAKREREYCWDSAIKEWEAAEIPKTLPEKYRGIYKELLDLYDPMELGAYWRKYGDESLWDLYTCAYGAG